MQVTETVSEGLKRQLKVVVPAADLKARADTKLEDLQSKVRLNGFRPGKVPLAHVRQLYGRSVMAEVVEQAVGETSAKALQDRQERPAFQPDIKLPEDKEAVERIIEGASDLEYTMSFEILPKIELTDLKSIALEKEAAEPEADDVNKALERLMKANVSYEAKDGPAEKDDRLTIDYKGSVGGEPFEGGAGEDAYIVLGSGRFIPGFEEGLLGATSGERRDIQVTFPEEYQAKHLAGKEAVFDVTVKEVAKPVEAKPDDEFARTLGMDPLRSSRRPFAASFRRSSMSFLATSSKRGCWTRSMSVTRSRYPRRSSRASSRASGVTSRVSSSRRKAASKPRARPKKTPAPSTGSLRSAACGLASSSRKSAM